MSLTQQELSLIRVTPNCATYSLLVQNTTVTPSIYWEAYQNPVVLELDNANQIPKSQSPKNFGFDFEGLMYNLDLDLIR